MAHRPLSHGRSRRGARRAGAGREPQLERRPGTGKDLFTNIVTGLVHSYDRPDYEKALTRGPLIRAFGGGDGNRTHEPLACHAHRWPSDP